jgi:hypothetical protein
VRIARRVRRGGRGDPPGAIPAGRLGPTQPFLVLSYTCDIPGATFPPVPALSRRWSADRRLSRAARAWKAEGTLALPADAGSRHALAGETARHTAGLQVPPPVFSACDSAIRNAATAVANNGANAPHR